MPKPSKICESLEHQYYLDAGEEEADMAIDRLMIITRTKRSPTPPPLVGAAAAADAPIPSSSAGPITGFRPALIREMAIGHRIAKLYASIIS